MNNQIVYFNEFQNLFATIIKNDVISKEFLDQFYEFLPSIFHYEEESEKINIDLIVILDIDKVLEKSKSYKKIKLANETLNNMNIRKKIKSFAPFCNNGWKIYISFYDKEVEYGILKNFAGINSLTIMDTPRIIAFKVKKIDKNIVEIQVKKDKEIHNLYLNLSITKREIKDSRKENIIKLVDCFTKDLKDKNSLKQFQDNIKNYLYFNFEKIHGTIITIVDSNQPIDYYFINGIILEEPINLYQEFENYQSSCLELNQSNISEKYYSMIGVLSRAVDIDGVTLLSSKGEILGFNIFIDDKNESKDTIVGGSRTRATHKIIKSNAKGLLGVYFQSEDGYSFFEEIKDEQ